MVAGAGAGAGAGAVFAEPCPCQLTLPFCTCKIGEVGSGKDRPCHQRREGAGKDQALLMGEETLVFSELGSHLNMCV